jgi:hypothetical protein
VYFVAIWYSLWFFGIVFTVLVCCTKKNLATLLCGAAPSDKKIEAVTKGDEFSAFYLQ